MNTTVSDTWPEKYVNGVRGGKVLNPEYVALWESYLDEGMACKHVAEVFGVGKSSVLNYYPGRGWTRKQTGEHGTFMKHHNAKMRKATFAKQM